MSSFDLDAFVSMFNKAEDPRGECVAMARTCEAAERYEDMCKFMKYLVEEFVLKSKDNTLAIEERNLLSVAYKNVIGTRRASWRTLMAEAESSDHAAAGTIQLYNGVVETELKKTCEEVLDLLDQLAPDKDTEKDAAVFYLKMAGDYYRYLAESIPKETEFAKNAEKKYKEAYDLAINNMEPTNPIRLGLALNFSVCYYEILKNKEKACQLAKDAFDDAISKLDRLGESDYKDSTLIMQLLRDNLTLWSASENDGDGLEVHDLDDDEN